MHPESLLLQNSYHSLSTPSLSLFPSKLLLPSLVTKNPSIQNHPQQPPSKNPIAHYIHRVRKKKKSRPPIPSRPPPPPPKHHHEKKTLPQHCIPPTETDLLSRPHRLDNRQRRPVRDPDPDVPEARIRLGENLLPVAAVALAGVEEGEHDHVHCAVGESEDQPSWGGWGDVK